MLRAWNELDAAALAAGWRPILPTIWETVRPGTGIEAAGPAGATAAARFDSRASVVATGRETQAAARVPAKNRKRRPVGFPEPRTPLPDPHPEPSSTKPPIDWDRGDDILV